MQRMMKKKAHKNRVKLKFSIFCLLQKLKNTIVGFGAGLVPAAADCRYFYKLNECVERESVSSAICSQCIL